MPETVRSLVCSIPHAISSGDVCAHVGILPTSCYPYLGKLHTAIEGNGLLSEARA